MANLAASAVTITRAWCEGGVTGKEISCRQVSLVLTGQGGVTNQIPASVLGLSVITQAGNFVKSDNTQLATAHPSADGSILLMNQGTATPPITAGDVTGTFIGVVKGYL